MRKNNKSSVQISADTTILKKSLQESEQLIEQTFSKLSGMDKLSFGSAQNLVTTITDWADAISTLEEKMNLSSESAINLLAVGEAVGLSLIEMSNAMVNMSSTAELAAASISLAAETGNLSTDVFTRFGIQILDTNGKLLTAEQLLLNVASRHREMNDAVNQTTLKMEVFGNSCVKSNSLMSITAEKFSMCTKAAEEISLVLNNKVVQSLKKTELSLNNSSNAAVLLASTFGSVLVPNTIATTNVTNALANVLSRLAGTEVYVRETSLGAASGVDAVTASGQRMIAIAGPWIKSIKDLVAAYNELNQATSAKSGFGISADNALGLFNSLPTILKIPLAVGFATTAIYSDINGISTEEKMRRYFDNPNDPKSISQANNSNNIKAETVAQDSSKYEAVEVGSYSGSYGGASVAPIPMMENINPQFDAQNILSGIEEASRQAAEFQSIWNGFKENEDNSLFGQIDAQVAQVRQAYEDSKNARLQAEAEGNAGAAELLAQTEAERLEILTRSEEEAKSIKENSLYQQKDAMQKQQAEALRDEEEYNALLRQMLEDRLTEEEALRMEQLEQKASEKEEEKALLEAYDEWRREADESYLEFGLQAAEALQSKLSAGIADAVVNGGKLSDVFKDVGKQIVQMFIQWQINRMMAGAFAQAMGKKEAAAKIAQAKAEALAWTPAAIAYETLHPGASAQAAISVSAAMKGTENVVACANGGLITAPTFALIGEGKHDEAVIPLKKGIFSDLLGIDTNELGSGSTVVEQNIYGDVNNAADVGDLFEALNEMVASGRRG